MALHRRSPRSVGQALGPLQAAMAPQTLLAEVQSLWPATVGALIAEQARPSHERAGVLTVRCSAAVWSQELELMGEEILLRLNPQLQRGRIARIRPVV